jgi:hypothetical protein
MLSKAVQSPISLFSLRGIPRLQRLQALKGANRDAAQGFYNIPRVGAARRIRLRK